MRYRNLSLLLSLIALPAWSEVYRWVDTQGHTHYGDRPPAKRARQADLPPLQFISAQPLAVKTSAGKPTQASARSTGHAEPTSLALNMTMSVASPRGDEVLRGAERKLPISVALKQALPEGGGLIFRIDGNPANRAPVRSLSYTATAVERGSHLVDVSMVDAGGREIGRTPPVLVHLKPPPVPVLNSAAAVALR